MKVYLDSGNYGFVIEIQFLTWPGIRTNFKDLGSFELDILLNITSINSL